MTRAVLLTSSGAVHRVVSDSNGTDMTACGQRYSNRWPPVSPKQALVFSLEHCADCWNEREHQWQHFVEGVEL